MTQEQYAEYAAAIEEGRVIEHEGRTAYDRAGLDAIAHAEAAADAAPEAAFVPVAVSPADFQELQSLYHQALEHLNDANERAAAAEAHVADLEAALAAAEKPAKKAKADAPAPEAPATPDAPPTPETSATPAETPAADAADAPAAPPSATPEA